MKPLPYITGLPMDELTTKSFKTMLSTINNKTAELINKLDELRIICLLDVAQVGGVFGCSGYYTIISLTLNRDLVKVSHNFWLPDLDENAPIKSEMRQYKLGTENYNKNTKIYEIIVKFYNLTLKKAKSEVNRNVISK